MRDSIRRLLIGAHVVLLYIPDASVMLRWLHCVIVSGTTGLELVLVHAARAAFCAKVLET